MQFIITNMTYNPYNKSLGILLTGHLHINKLAEKEYIESHVLIECCSNTMDKLCFLLTLTLVFTITRSKWYFVMKIKPSPYMTSHPQWRSDTK